MKCCLWLHEVTTSGFHIVISNAMEVLAGGLAELLAKPCANPLTPDTVLVQSKGMQKWASLAVAEHNGICANIDFPFPNAFFKDLYTKVIGPLPAEDPFEPGNLGFRIMAVLPTFLGRCEFKALDRYLSKNKHPLKLFQLSRKIADVFDQYSIFRPQMMVDWEKGIVAKHARQYTVEEQWQVILWQALNDRIRCPHRARRQKELVSKLTTGRAEAVELPERVMVFGISHLPPYHLRVLEALSSQLPVFFFLLNPCRHFWSDIISHRQKAYIHRKMGGRLDGDDSLHLESGNRLLASLGQQGREFINAIYQIPAQLEDSFLDNESHSLLGRIQQGILDLMDPLDTDPAQPGERFHDGTIRIQNCHSPMREVEVLHDQLLDMMSSYADIAFSDILVMAPDINAYLPYIQAVFGADSENQTQIPYTVADQSILNENPYSECFLKLLGLFYQRFEVSIVLALLEYPMIQQRFDLTNSDLPIIEGWIEKAGIRWGWDNQSRRQYGLPGFIENTWRMGLDRLLMGYCMSVKNGELMDGILPFAPIEGDQSRILGGLTLFAESLQQMVRGLNEQRTLGEWYDFLSSLIALFFVEGEGEVRDVQLLKEVAGQLRNIAAAADFGQPLGFDVIYQHLKSIFNRTAYEAGFLSGRVTFCALLPMRSIPAKVICLLGMNHDSFPRELHEPAFNLIAANPQPGDRSKRSDDRYLFLESLVSARRIFYLSYVGQDIQDNTIKPPSVIVDELSEYAEEHFKIPCSQLTTRHPLHAFSPRYFSRAEPELFSYNRDNYIACAALGHPRKPQPFFSRLLPLLDDQEKHCDLADLFSFFIHPALFFMKKRLGVVFGKAAAPVADRELFVAGALDKYHINNQLMALKDKEVGEKEAFTILNARGLLPHGSVGQVVYRQQKDELKAFMHAFSSHLPDGEPQNEGLTLRIGPFQVDGLIQDLYDRVRIVLRIGRTRPRDLIHLLLVHLMLMLPSNQRLPQTSRLICMDEVWEIGPVREASSLLQTYLECYWDGLHRPIPFFEQSSHAYAYQRLVRETSHRSAMASALKQWQGDLYRTGEGQDPHNQRCFNLDNFSHALPPGFEETALTLFKPVFDHCRPLRGG